MTEFVWKSGEFERFLQWQKSGWINTRGYIDPEIGPFLDIYTWALHQDCVCTAMETIDDLSSL